MQFFEKLYSIFDIQFVCLFYILLYTLINLYLVFRFHTSKLKWLTVEEYVPMLSDAELVSERTVIGKDKAKDKVHIAKLYHELNFVGVSSFRHDSFNIYISDRLPDDVIQKGHRYPFFITKSKVAYSLKGNKILYVLLFLQGFFSILTAVYFLICAVLFFSPS